MYEDVKVALDPTPAQERRLLSHAGAARFAFNATLAHVKKAIESGENLNGLSTHFVNGGITTRMN